MRPMPRRLVAGFAVAGVGAVLNVIGALWLLSYEGSSGPVPWVVAAPTLMAVPLVIIGGALIVSGIVVDIRSWKR